MKKRRKLAILSCLLPVAAMAAGHTAKPRPPQPFSATYKVLRDGSPLGVSTLTLTQNADGTWTYRSMLDAQSGLAALLGGSVDETSHFRWHGGRIESLAYDYKLDTAIMGKQRHVTVNWHDDTVTVRTSDDGTFHYKPQPGLVERHVLVLALGRAVAAGKTRIGLPVAVKDRVETQTFAVRGTEPLKVPAGTFHATRVERTHDDKGYTVWYDPQRFGNVPVKLSQQSGGDITLLLKHYER